MTWTVIIVGRFVDSKLKEDWVELDRLGVYQRLGYHSDLVVGFRADPQAEIIPSLTSPAACIRECSGLSAKS